MIPLVVSFLVDLVVGVPVPRPRRRERFVPDMDKRTLDGVRRVYAAWARERDLALVHGEREAYAGTIDGRRVELRTGCGTYTLVEPVLTIEPAAELAAEIDLVASVERTPGGLRIALETMTDPEVFDRVLEATDPTTRPRAAPYR